MSTSDTSSIYFIRVRGRVLGPYSVAQLRALRGRGQFSRANEISTDRLTWQSAAAIENLFGGAAKQTGPVPGEATAAPPTAVPGGSPPSRTVHPVWHYAVGSEQYGPVTLLELRGLVTSGQLTADDLVWKEGLADWTPVSDVGELNAVKKPNLTTATPQQFSAPAALLNFCYACGTPTDARAEVCPQCGVRQSPRTGAGDKDRMTAALALSSLDGLSLEHGAGDRDRMTAALLAFFLGGLGVHHFYLGNTLLGVLYLLFCWTFVPAIIAFIEFVVFLCMSDVKFAAKYGKRG